MKNSKKIDRDSIISFLRENKKFIESEFGVKKIALFGSYVRGDQTSKSDIDLIVDILDPSLKKHCELKRYLKKHFNKEVDISYFKGMRSFIKREIEKEIVYA